jgi:ParB/RepB/Spo0J family partition protein
MIVMQPVYHDGCIMRVSITRVIPSDKNIRQSCDPDELEKLKHSLIQHGQLHPIQVIAKGELLEIVEGHRRHACLLEQGASEIDVILLRSDMTETERTVFALVVNCKREDIHYLDRGDVFAELKMHHGWSQTQLATEANEDLSTTNKLLAIQRLDSQVKTILRLQKIGFVKAWELTQLDSVEKQMAHLSCNKGSLGKTIKTVQPTKRVICPLGSGITVSVTGTTLDYEGLLLSLEFVLKEARKYRSKGIEVGTLGKVFQDQVKQKGRAD